MKRIVSPMAWLGLVCVLSLSLSASTVGAQEAIPARTLAPLGTGFSYQGELLDGAEPVSGICDFQFKLLDASSGGLQLGSTQSVSSVTVSEGQFSVLLNNSAQFGSDAFTGEARWLEMAVRCPAGSGTFTTLAPRQALTATPYAFYSQSSSWNGLMDVPAGFADGVDNVNSYTAGSGLSLKDNSFSIESVAWDTLTGIPAGFGDDTDNDTTYTAGTGLMLDGSTFSVQSVPWTSLSGTPAGFADNTDNDTTYTAGTGLVLSSGAFQVQFSGTGVSGNASRSDHNHGGDDWVGSSLFGLRIQNDTTNSLGSGIVGVVTQANTSAGIEGRHESATGNGSGVYGISKSSSGIGVEGFAFSLTGSTRGVLGISESSSGIGVSGLAASLTGNTVGVFGSVASPDGRGISGYAASLTGATAGVFGSSESNSGVGVSGYAASPTGTTIGVFGSVMSPNGRGISGYASSLTGITAGVFGSADSSNGVGVSALAASLTGSTAGVFGSSASSSGVGVSGYAASATGLTTGVLGGSESITGTGVAGIAYSTSGVNVGVYGSTNSSIGWAGFFDGDVNINGTLFKSGGAFRIDHPLDPENKYLTHSFVESPDMMNVYNGNITLDASGEGWVELPGYFEALNKDFRYQLTAIGASGPNLYIAETVSNNRFKIAGGTANLNVSWQVTGVRQDTYALENPIVVEQDKVDTELGGFAPQQVLQQGIEPALHDSQAVQNSMSQMQATQQNPSASAESSETDSNTWESR